MFFFTLLAVVTFLVAAQCYTFVHEYGHYIVAKKVGLPVLRFKVGWGKAIFEKYEGITQIKICWGPFQGGVVHVLSSRSEEILRLRSYEDYTQKLREDSEFSEELQRIKITEKKLEDLPTWKIVLFFLGGPCLEIITGVSVILSLIYFAPEAFEPYLLGIKLASCLHILVAIAQLLPIYWKNAGSDGFNIILYGVAFLTGGEVGKIREKLKYISWIFWAILLLWSIAVIS